MSAIATTIASANLNDLSRSANAPQNEGVPALAPQQNNAKPNTGPPDPGEGTKQQTTNSSLSANDFTKEHTPATTIQKDTTIPNTDLPSSEEGPRTHSTDFQTLYEYFYSYPVPASQTRTGGAITRNGPVNDNNEVVSFTTETALVTSLTPRHIDTNIQPLQISIADDCVNYSCQYSGQTCPIFDGSQHVQSATALASSMKARLMCEVTQSLSARPVQQPQIIAYLYGALLALGDRLNIHYGNKVNLWNALLGHNLQRGAPINGENFNHHLLIDGPLAPPILPAAGLGPFPSTTLGPNTTVTFKARASIFVRPQTYDYALVDAAFWLIYAMYSRMPVAFRQSYSLNIDFFTVQPMAACVFPGHDGFTTPVIDQALGVLESMLVEMFNGDREIMYYYAFKGGQVFMRPCSCYQEGGLIRKASRNVSLASFTGIYSLIGYCAPEARPLHAANHPGIIAALFQYVDTMVLQAVLSYSGPKLIHFGAAPEFATKGSTPYNFIDPDNYWGIRAGVNAHPVGYYYLDILMRQKEHQLLDETLSDIYGHVGSLAMSNIMASIASSGTEVLNQKMQKSFVRRGNQVRALRHSHAIINRFHEPEYAYRLGILADGIMPLSGTHKCNIIDEATRLLEGEDIRNLPGLRCLRGRGLDAIVGIRPINKKRRAGFYTLDGNFHVVTNQSTSDILQVWNDHGYIARPYACHIVESINVEIYDKSNGAYEGWIQALVGGFGVPERCYMGPSSAGSRRRPLCPLKGSNCAAALHVDGQLYRASRLPYRKLTTSHLNCSKHCARQLAVIYRYQTLSPQLTEVSDADYLAFLRWVLLPYTGATNRPHPKRWPKPFYPREVNLKFLDKETELQLFPLKKVPQADLKVNCFARNLLYSSPLSDRILKQCIPVGTNNDTVCGLIILLELLFEAGVPLDLLPIISVAIAKNDPFVKALSDFNKMTGATTSHIANLLTECATLLGRGVAGSEPNVDLYHRVAPEGNPHEAKISDDVLRSAIRTIYKQEIKDCPKPGDFRLHLLTSPFWCKSGSHHHPEFPSYRNRLEFVMNTDPDNIIAVKPSVYITQAQKLEHGKTRYIYNCDTVSYLYFDYILNYIESIWANSHVLLNPDALNAEKFATLEYPKYCMIDYTDFNSQHTLTSMKVVFEVLKEFLPSEMFPVLDWCITSFDNMTIRDKKWRSTLPSGHRATTFINSVLNRAYLLPYIGTIVSYHCGDDVLLCGDYDYQNLITRLPYELNPSKQSFGPHAEFLRLHRHGEKVIGYPTRAISSLVSGNWLSTTSWNWQPSLLSVTNQINAIICRSQLSINRIRSLAQELRFRYCPLFDGYIDPATTSFVAAGCPSYQPTATMIIPDVPHLDAGEVEFAQLHQLAKYAINTYPWLNSVESVDQLVRNRMRRPAAQDIRYSILGPAIPLVSYHHHCDPMVVPPARRYYPRDHLAPPITPQVLPPQPVFCDRDLSPIIALKIAPAGVAVKVTADRPIASA
uniref:RNA-directed RNA polymerase n=1 Tax=Trichomonas vaginalis virus 4 TaxID=1008292 RepID=F5B2V8_9VIRU|nr:RNA-dependent RNA polymerase [Trichomonas vaginalis virus 4]